MSIGIIGSFFSIVLIASLARSQSTEELLIRLLIKKGIVTNEEVQALKKEAEVMNSLPTEPQSAVQDLVDTLRDEVRQEFGRRDEESIGISLKLEGEGRWLGRQGTKDNKRGFTSDIFLRRAELGLEARLADFMEGRVVLASEWLGTQKTDQGLAADASLTVDEATLTMRSEKAPQFYGVVGKRTQPFGAFFSRLVTDPMSQDAYEVKQVGATLGFRHRGTDMASWEKNFSLTLYRGEEQLNHFFDSGLFDSSAVVRSAAAGLRQETKRVSSFVFASSLAPFKDLILGTAYLSESGDGRRNQTGAIWAGYNWGRLSMEAEFFTALSRERYVLQRTGERYREPFKEKMLLLGLAYRPMKALELATRYGHLWDDGLADRAKSWSVRNRFSIGSGYTIYERGDIGVQILGEYRFTDYRKGGSGREVTAPNENGLFTKLSVSYK